MSELSALEQKIEELTTTVEQLRERAERAEDAAAKWEWVARQIYTARIRWWSPDELYAEARDE